MTKLAVINGTYAIVIKHSAAQALGGIALLQICPPFTFTYQIGVVRYLIYTILIYKYFDFVEPR